MKNNLGDRSRRYQSMDGFLPPRRPDYIRPNGLTPQHPVLRQPPTDMRPRRPVYRSTDQPLSASRPSKFDVAPALSQREMNLPGERSLLETAKPRRHRFRTFRKWTLRSATVVVVVALVGGGYLFSKGYLQLHKVFTGGASSAALNAQVNPADLKGEGSGRVNILLLGIGGNGHDGPDLTDTMMVASIDVVNHKIDLLSVPRDLWVKEPNNFIENYGKINAAYESGKYKYLGELSASNDNDQAINAGFQAADETVSNVIGIPINYNVLVNFQAFQQGVDAVGGIDINVPTELYDPTMAWQNNWNPVLAQAGEQHMDGYQALLYSRSRETTSDFARTERQRAVLEALKSKVMTAGTLSNPIAISNLLGALGNNVRTDISLGDMQQLYGIIKSIPSSAIDSVSLDEASNPLVTTASLDGQSVVEPNAGLFEYSDIQSFVRNTLRDGYLAKENALVQVLNGTATAGLATDQTDVLKSYGYRVASPGDAPSQAYQKTVIVDLTHGQDKYTAHYLERRYGVSTTTVLPAGITANGDNFVIILGQDEANGS